MKKKGKLILGSALSIAACVSIAAGATFAIFTSNSTVDIAVTSAYVNVTATIDEDNVVLYSPKAINQDGTIPSGGATNIASAKSFANGGTASVKDGAISVEAMSPGDKVSFNVKITNNSNINVNYRSAWSAKDEEEGGLLDALTFTVDGVEYSGADGVSVWRKWSIGGEKVRVVPVSVKMNETADIETYGDRSCTIQYSVTAVQGNVAVSNDKTQIPETTTISTVAELRSFAETVNAGESYVGKTVVLAKNLDLKGEAWMPIGSTGTPFQGTFDGNDKTISNLYVNQPKTTGVGLFGYISVVSGKSTVIQNLTINNAEVSGLSCVGALVGDGYTGKIMNCHVTGDVKIEGNYDVGGLMGYGYASVNGCSVLANEGSTVTGTFLENNLEGDNVGGLVGYLAETSATMGNLSVSNLTVSGTRKVGGIFGSVGTYTRTLENISVESATVICNADETYQKKNAGKLFVGGVVGECIGTAVTFTGSVSNATVHGVEGCMGTVIGGSRTAGFILNVDGLTETNNQTVAIG